MTDRTEAMDALIAQDADLIDVEPVAWMYAPTDRNDAASFTMFSKCNMDPRYWTETPLYTHPPADRIEALEAALREVFEEWAGSEGFVPETAPEGYLLQLTKRMADIARAALAGDSHDQ